MRPDPTPCSLWIKKQDRFLSKGAVQVNGTLSKTRMLEAEEREERI